ncbi:CU044_2847 family protein [Streptomyces sp. NBC_00038]|uniref:CU044_2847 family protein n=1 Tax=Streptomyces sp. NBC_00038 TaxID=2903615 RepID=UPI00224EF22E|nr:CU044_2847 family protein [Streptomyces sp. NBC_00038]MCX5560681.1 CU044_2847 family protein [Streptomyces sp. NBC_00038]
MVILVGPVPAGADGPIPVEVDTDLHPAATDDLDLVYGDEATRAGSARRVVEVARDVYGEGLDLARRCAAQAVRRFGELEEHLRPDEIELQLSIKVDAGVAALVKSGAEAQLQITFKWQTSTAPDGAPDSPARSPEGAVS